MRIICLLWYNPFQLLPILIIVFISISKYCVLSISQSYPPPSFLLTHISFSYLSLKVLAANTKINKCCITLSSLWKTPILFIQECVQGVSTSYVCTCLISALNHIPSNGSSWYGVGTDEIRVAVLNLFWDYKWIPDFELNGTHITRKY